MADVPPAGPFALRSRGKQRSQSLVLRRLGSPSGPNNEAGLSSTGSCDAATAVDPFALRAQNRGNVQPMRRSRLGLLGNGSRTPVVELLHTSDAVGIDHEIPSTSTSSSVCPRGKRRSERQKRKAHELESIEAAAYSRKSRRLRSVESMSEADSETSMSCDSGRESCPAQRKRKRVVSSNKTKGQRRRKACRQASTAVPRAAVGQALPVERLMLSPPTYCHRCYARKFQFESDHFCCSKGEVKLAMNGFPAELLDLYTKDDELGKHFRQYSRMYNNLFAFSSIGGNIDAASKKGFYVFKLHGQIYHFVPDLLPGDGKPKYLQMYFYDGQFEALSRSNTFPEVKAPVIDILMRVTAVNPYARFFRSLREINIDADTQVVLNQSPVLDQRVYNKPTTNEVAVIWPESASSSDCLTPHILIRGHGGEAHRIYHDYGCYDPLQYPLLFPYGECGWRQGIKKNVSGQKQTSINNPDPINSCVVHNPNDFIEEEHRRATKHRTRADKFISPREYYAYKLQIRAGNVLLLTGRSLQQFAVDMYVKTENTRLDYVRHNQATIRADLYQGILDSFEDGVRSAGKVGHRIVLPPSFIGGPRDLKRRYLNAMALVQRYGKPDFFITMTCNANWPEIQDELLPHQSSDDRPDLVARVFRAKLLSLRQKIMKEHVFGEVAAMIYVVEFQKRGLPHAHFLIILQPKFRVKEPADYDRFVCAELPPATDALLRKSVLSHMMHGPCGHLRPDCPCMRTVNGKSSCRNN